MAGGTLYYFAYGSNADPDRFRGRVGRWVSRRAAILEGYRLRFSACVVSEGGGGAVIDRCPGDRVVGVVYEITAQQLQAMDAEEFDPTRDTEGKGFRAQVEPVVDGTTLTAETYTVRDDGAWRGPSERYLGYILRGLQSAGFDESALEQVRRIAAEARRE